MARRLYTAKLIDLTTGDEFTMGSGTTDIDIDESGSLRLITSVEKLCQDIDFTLITEKSNKEIDGDSGSEVPRLMSTKFVATTMPAMMEVYIIQTIKDLRKRQLSYGLAPDETLGEIKPGSYYLELYRYNKDPRRVVIKLHVTDSTKKGKVINHTMMHSTVA